MTGCDSFQCRTIVVVTRGLQLMARALRGGLGTETCLWTTAPSAALSLPQSRRLGRG